MFWPWIVYGDSKSLAKRTISDKVSKDRAYEITIKTWLNFTKTMTLTHKNVDNICVFYEIDLWSNIQGAGFALGNSLFGAVKLIKNADPDKYRYSCYGIRFDAPGFFSSLHGSGFSKNIIKFCADMNSLVHTDKKKDIFILSKGPTDGLDDTTLTAKKEYL